MMKRKLSIILTAALLLGSLCACGGEAGAPADNNPTEISIWYTDDGSSMFTNLVQAVADYNSGAGAQAGISIRLEKSFDDDEALLNSVARAGSKLPDVVISGRDAAMSLSRLGAATCTDGYEDSFTGLGIPAAYMNAASMDDRLISVPLAVSVPMLLVNTALTDAAFADGCDFTSLESLCAAAAVYENATGQHFFTVTSFSELFRLGLAQMETDFHADRQRDIENRQYIYLYNLLAVAAYEGGLTTAEGSVAKLVAGGEFACGLTTSVDIMQNASDADLKSFDVLACPVIRNGLLLYSLDFTMASITARDEDKQEASAKFIKWLVENSYTIAGESGHFSSLSDLTGSYVNGKTPGSGLLVEIGDTARKTAKRRTLYVPAAQAEYFTEGLAFEDSFRETLKGLN